MRIYLDMCCYNRPYDPQEQLTVAMETQSKLHIQQWIEEGKFDLVGSYTLDYECGNIPSPLRRRQIKEFVYRNAKLYVSHAGDDEISKKAEEIMKTNVKEYDAFHVASAIYANCAYFITVDYRLLKYQTNEIRMVSPIEFVMEMEGQEDGVSH